MVSGHTHRAYNCRIDGRLVTSGDKYGTIVTDIDLVLDPTHGDVRQASANNVIVRTASFAKDAAQTQLIGAYEKLAVPLAKRVVGRIAAPLSRDDSPAGETPLGQVIADAQLAATTGAGAQIALMNPGGMRATLAGARRRPGALRGPVLRAALLQQPGDDDAHRRAAAARARAAVVTQARPRMLQVSRGFTYTWDAEQAAGPARRARQPAPERRAARAAAGLRVTVNSFMASGGDGFTVFKQDGRDRRTGVDGHRRVRGHVQRAGTIAPGTLDRIARLN